jgi:hypothetical protein
MNSRHAAALALVAWYLMVPPLVNAPYKIDMETPVLNWKVYQTFSSEEECRKAQASAQAKYEPTADAPVGTIQKGTRAFALQMSFAKCIASDDPRLKVN